MNFNIYFTSLTFTVIVSSLLIVYIIYKQNRLLSNIFNLTSFIAKTSNIKKEIEDLKLENMDITEEVKFNSIIFYNVKEPICVLDKDFKFISVNPAFEKVLDLNLDDVIGNTIEIINSGNQDDEYYKNLYEFCSKNESSSFEMWTRGINGSSFYHIVKITKIIYNSEPQYILIFSDITEMKQNEIIIYDRSKHDNLTGLPNRSLFLDRLDSAISIAKRNKIVGAVMFLDLDHFKSLNDTFGHRVGDLLLIEVAKRLKSIVRESDTVCRLAGDEFTIILTEIAKSEDAAIVAEKIIKCLNEEYFIENNKIKTSCSLGISIFPVDGLTVDSIIHAADQAMYNVKKDGRNQYRFYSSNLDVEANRKIELIDELVKAANEDQFYLEYLPAYKNNESISHYDVLIRWKHPVLGDIKPLEFIPLAEESNLIMEITNWVIKKSFIELEPYLLEFKKKNIKLCFKLSSIHFKQNDIVDNIVNLVGTEFIDIVQIKIDEPIISKNIEEAKEKIQLLMDKGFYICIDDFGTGKISFLDLLDLKFNSVKIPRELIKNINTNSNYNAAVKSLIILAKNLNVFITIEGIENEDQVYKIKDYIDDKMFLQGHYYSKPLLIKELIENN